MSAKEIYFHVGLGRVASTYLQKEVFPNLQGLHYLSPRHYKNYEKRISQIRADKILVSREFDRQFDQEVERFARSYPEARVIIAFRRQDEWVASQYRRYVKNGWYHSFEKFFNLDDSGFWKREDLDYLARLNKLKSCFQNEPLVLVYDELNESPERFLERICRYTGCRFRKQPARKVVHASFSAHQLKVLQRFCRTFIRTIPKGRKNKVLHWLFYRPVWAVYHMILYVAPLLPKKWTADEKLIDQKYLEKIRKYFEEDWAEIIQRANN